MYRIKSLIDVSPARRHFSFIATRKAQAVRLEARLHYMQEGPIRKKQDLRAGVEGRSVALLEFFLEPLS